MSSRSSSPLSSRSNSPSPVRDGSKSPSRSRSGSRSSRSSSRSVSSPAKRASRSPASSSRSRSRSPVSRTSSRSRSRSRSASRSVSRSSRSPSSASSRSPSPEEKVKLKVKIKNRHASKALKEKISKSEEDEEDEEEDARPKRGKKKSPVKKGAVEDGEISSDNSAQEFDDGLDDDLIGDDDDRAKLEKMTEREREEELFKRAEIRENERKRFEIQKKLKQQQKLKGETSKAKKKDSDDDIDFEFTQSGLDTKERSQNRRRDLDAMKFDKKSSALSELKARKQERERKEKERNERKEAESKDSDEGGRRDKKRKGRRDSSSSSSGGSYRRRSSSSSSSASSSASDSDTDRFDRRAPKVQKYVETQVDLEPIRLSRHKLERFVHLPFFKRLVIGCFVRIGIGQSEGRSVYRCTEIVDVVETAKVYQMGRQRTNIGLKLKFGKQERVFRLEFVSNQPFSPTEFEKWKYTCEEGGHLVPTKDFVQSKSDEIKKAISYEYSSADVDAMLEKKEKFNKNPVNYAMKKARLMKEKEIADAENDPEKSAELEGKLKELEQRAEELDKRRTEKSSISSVSLINDRNRKRNVLKAELAIFEEIKRKEVEGVVDNPFLRRKCNPRMVTKSVDPEVTAETLKKLAEKQKAEKENKEGEKRKAEEQQKKDDDSKSKKPKLGEKAKSKEDLFDAHDFDIEIDVGATLSNGGPSSNPVNVNVKPVSIAPKDTGPTKRSLNLSDYKKKRGLI